MANRTDVDTRLQIPRPFMTDEDQLKLFDDSDAAETAGGCAPAGVGRSQIKAIPSIYIGFSKETLPTYRQLQRFMKTIEALQQRSTAQQDRALTDAVEALDQAPLTHVTPPLNSQFLLDLFLPESRCEEFLGDLAERYNKKLVRLGQTRADWWYRKQVATSLAPLCRAWMRRASKGSMANIMCFLLRLLGQSSLADVLKKAADEERKRSI